MNSIRNVLFILSLDWLPLHKIGNYSLGILSISAANHTKTRRSRGGVWPLVLLEGPREPKVLFSLLSDAIREIEVLFQVGCTVSDTLTGENIHVRAGIVTTVNDLPASSKLGLLCRFCHLSHLMNCLCPCHTTVQLDMPVTVPTFSVPCVTLAVVFADARQNRTRNHRLGSTTDPGEARSRHQLCRTVFRGRSGLESTLSLWTQCVSQRSSFDPKLSFEPAKQTCGSECNPRTRHRSRSNLSGGNVV